MLLHLQLVLSMQVVVVYSQTCYTQCLEETAGDATEVTIMTHDYDYLDGLASQGWLDGKAVEFNGQYPAINVTLIHMKREEMVSEALQDWESGSNKFHAYVIANPSVYGMTSMLADGLMDLSTFTVGNVNDVAWQTIGRYFRSHSALYQGRVLTLPLAGDFLSLYYREDIFASHGVEVPRTLKEFVLTSQSLNGTDMNGDGELDYGACVPLIGELSTEYIFVWITQTLQYRGTSQGSVLDTDSLTPLLTNPVVQEAIRLWQQVAGPPVPDLTTMVSSWYAGRCAMVLTGSSFYTTWQRPLFNGTIAAAIWPGSKKVWSRDTEETIVCNLSSCRHATQYQDGSVVNHAPTGLALLDGAINSQVDASRQLAAYTFFTWLMNDANMLEAVVNPPSWPNLFGASYVKPKFFVPSVWAPYGWRDPGLSTHCATSTTNLEHPNAYIGLRLPNSPEYYAAVREVLHAYWWKEDEFADLDEDDGAIVASWRLTSALEAVTDRGDRTALVMAYQKSLNIYEEEPTRSAAMRSAVFPPWATHAVVALLSGALCLASSVFVCWLSSTLRQRRRLRREQQAGWEEIVDAAETYPTALGCPMALISATHFFECGCFVKFEILREEGKLRVLDTTAKVLKFRQKCLVVFLSHQWFGESVVDPSGVHYRTMCAAVHEATKIANSGLDKVFLWVDCCSIPQEHMATRELFLAAVPLYVSLADFMLVIAPPTMHDNSAVDLSTYLRGGWCRAELLARLIACGVHRLFLCEACDGTLQQVEREVVRALDLSVFHGVFACCASGHVGGDRCDRERLRTPILGVFGQHLRASMRYEEAADDPARTDVLPVAWLERGRERLFPTTFEFVTTHRDLTSSVQVRELFGPLPEMLEKRIRASGGARNDLGASGVESVHLEQSAVTPQRIGLSLALPSLEEAETVVQGSGHVEDEEYTVLESTSQQRPSRGQAASTVPLMKVNRPHSERGTGSCASPADMVLSDRQEDITCRDWL